MPGVNDRAEVPRHRHADNDHGHGSRIHLCHRANGLVLTGSWIS